VRDFLFGLGVWKKLKDFSFGNGCTFLLKETSRMTESSALGGFNVFNMTNFEIFVVVFDESAEKMLPAELTYLDWTPVHDQADWFYRKDRIFCNIDSEKKIHVHISRHKHEAANNEHVSSKLICAHHAQNAQDANIEGIIAAKAFVSKILGITSESLHYVTRVNFPYYGHQYESYEITIFKHHF